MFETIDIAIASLWVAICAVAPEFIWRGARVVFQHANWGDLGAALLVGLILVCYVEPVMQLLHRAWTRQAHHETHNGVSSNLLFTLLVGLVFALASVLIHDAVTAFLALDEQDRAARWSALVTGIRLASAWTIVPFLVTFAWLNIGRKFWRWVLAFLALASPAAAAWEFSWSVQDWAATQIPCAFILASGYKHWPAEPNALFLRRCAKSLLWICPLWLISALCFDGLAALLRADGIRLYSATEFWIDTRFYFGWISGLFLAPVPLVLRGSKRSGLA